MRKGDQAPDGNFSSGSAAVGAALSNPPTPRHEGGGVGVNKKPCVRSYELEEKMLKTIV